MNKEEINLLNEMLENCRGGFDYYTDSKAEAKAHAIESALNLQQRFYKAIGYNYIVSNSDYVYSQDEIANKNISILKGENNE